MEMIKDESLKELLLLEQAQRIVQEEINSGILQKGIEASMSSQSICCKRLSPLINLEELCDLKLPSYTL